MMVIGILAGYKGYRPLETFASEYQQVLYDLLGLAVS